MVTVQFTAPAGAGTTNATIANSDGTRTASVAVTGTAVAPPAPTITTFAPISGPVGTTVTITGTNFTGAIGVSFNGTAATSVTVVSTTSVQAVVPTGATTGTLAVSNANGTATSTGIFTVTGPALAPLAAGLLLVEDDFNYAVGSLLTANGWALHSGSADVPAVVAGNLTQPTYPTGPLTPAATANQVLSNGVSADVNKGFAVPTGQNSIYYSALVNVPTGGTGTAADYVLHLLERTNAAGTTVNSFFRAKLFIQPSTSGLANKFNFGISVTSNPAGTPAPVFTPGSAAADYAEGQTYLVVVKYVYAPGSSDAVSLFVYDNMATLPGTEPATPTLGPLLEVNNASASLPNGLAIRQTGTSTHLNIDGVRVATGWGAVVGNATYTEAAAVANAGNYYTLAVTAAAQLTPNGAVSVENALTLTNGLVNTSATNSLTLYQTATINGGSASSFVNGPLARITAPGAATVGFPIGKGSAYRPLTLNTATQTSTTTYTGEVINSTARTAVPLGTTPTPLTRVSNVRYATLTASSGQPTGYIGTITLSFDADDLVNYPQDGSFVVAKRDGGSAGTWQNIGHTAATGTANGGNDVAGTLTSGIFTSFSDFSLASTAPASNNAANTSNPLPVELTRFAAVRQSAAPAVSLTWATASEQNSTYFEIERSLNGKTFATIATVTAQGNTAQASAYAILDREAPTAQLYYRLRQVDADGTAAYSPVVAIAATAKAMLRAYPNPTTDAVTLTMPTTLGQLVSILDLSGREVRRIEASATGQVSLRGLPAGTYLLHVRTSSGLAVCRVVKEITTRY